MSEPVVRTIVRDTGTYVLALATLVGLYFAADQVGLVWVFWWVLALAFLLAVGRIVIARLIVSWRQVRELIAKGRKFDNTLRVAAIWQERFVELERTLTSLEDAGPQLEAASVLEGRRRFAGELAAYQSRARLSLVSMGLIGGECVLAATIAGAASPPIGSHWHLKVLGLNQTKAVLRVIAFESPWVKLVIDRVDDVEYMDGLVRQAGQDSTVPASLVIECRPVHSPLDLLEEG
jgi:hypothetical protein